MEEIIYFGLGLILGILVTTGWFFFAAIDRANKDE